MTHWLTERRGQLFLLLLFLGGVFRLFAQPADKELAKQFWNDNIAAIAHGNKNRVIAQVHYPLIVNKTKREEWSKEKFIKRYETIFTESVTSELRNGSIKDIWQMNSDKPSIYMISCAESAESMTTFIFYFKQFNGKWMLYQVDARRE